MAENRNRALILIVDDDPALSEMLQIVLRQEGFDTTHCATGTGAVGGDARMPAGPGAARPDAAGT